MALQDGDPVAYGFSKTSRIHTTCCRLKILYPFFVSVNPILINFFFFFFFFFFMSQIVFLSCYSFNGGNNLFL